MNRAILITTALASALALAGCNSNNSGDRAIGGAVLGGAAGALIGGAATGRAGGALVGGLAGAATGAVIGAATTPQQQQRQCAEIGYDAYGNQVCYRYY